MMNLAEYRRRSQCLADFLPWAALVEKGVILNKDGSFQRTARFRGPDLILRPLANSSRSPDGSTTRCAAWAPAGRSSSRRSVSRRTSIRTTNFPTPPPALSTPNAGRSSRRKARISRAGIS